MLLYTGYQKVLIIHVLQDLLVDKLDDDEYRIVGDIIDSTNKEYINEEIIGIKNKLLEYDIKRREEIKKIPLYNYDKGLGIGYSNFNIM